VYDLAKFNEKFDVVLCLGVYYHLYDPFYAFAQIRHRCHESSIVIFEGDVIFSLIEAAAQSIALYSRDVRRAPRFVPDPDTLRFFVNSTYFHIIDESVFRLSASHPNEGEIRGIHRMLLVCRPFSGFNSCHEYQPPFGLMAYDSRRALPPEKWSDLFVSGH
jgi:tRNA (mo5U34)-methyltransferase